MMIVCATREIRYAHLKNGDEAPRGWLASAVLLDPPNRKISSVGTGATRREAMLDLETLLEENGIAEPRVYETGDPAIERYLLRKASLHARLRGIGIEFV
jgi:hypothetical protein